MRLSFIIPTYNTGKLIGECLQSVTGQVGNFLETEIIVVDDGSTDNTEEIIGEYKKQIRYIKKENSGVSDARNVGIRESTGDYLCFVDADDYISPFMSDSLIESIKTEPDIVYFGYYEGSKSAVLFNSTVSSKMSICQVENGGGTDTFC